MDIISSGVANKAAKEEKNVRNNVLAVGVEGSDPSVRTRLDKLDASLDKAVQKANKLIINDAINIMKAHAKLNTIAKTKRYEMHNMAFDDLLDLSGIDTTKSNGYKYDSVEGTMTAETNCVIETKEEVADAVPSKMILTVEEKNSVGYGDSYIPKLTSNASVSPIVVSASSLPNNAWKSFNKVIGEFWESNGQIEPGKGWIQVDFGEPIVVTKYSIQPGAASGGPSAWYFYGSQDGNSYIQLDYQSSKTESFWGNKTITYKKEFMLQNSKSYRYYRLHVVQGLSALKLDEIEMMGSIISNDVVGKYFISRNNGTTWESITPDTLFYFKNSISPHDNKLRLKVELPSGAKLLNYGLTWS